MNVNLEKVKIINIADQTGKLIETFKLAGAQLTKPDYVLTLRKLNKHNVIEKELICPACNCNKAFWNPAEEESQCPCGHTWTD